MEFNAWMFDLSCVFEVDLETLTSVMTDISQREDVLTSGVGVVVYGFQNGHLCDIGLSDVWWSNVRVGVFDFMKTGNLKIWNA